MQNQQHHSVFSLGRIVPYAVFLLISLSHPGYGAVPVTRNLVLHLDANSITGLTDGNVVSVWPDLSGRGNHAAIGAGTVNQPVYKTGVLNGLPLVRFGPNNSYFTFSEISDIRTVFWVCKEETSATGNRFLLGHSNYWDFHRGWHDIWDPTWTNPYVLNGTTRLNGSVVNGTTTAVPAGYYALISLVTTGRVRANQLTRDRDNTAASWHGDIAEILVYNRVLTASEIADVEFYLNQKYFPAVSPTSCNISSPDGNLVATLVIDESSHLACCLRKAGVTVLEKSLIGITVDGVDLGQGVTADWDQSAQEVNETYPWRGLKSQVTNHYNAVSFPIMHAQTGIQWTLECRMYDDGFTYRYMVPGSGSRTVNDEATEWVLSLSASMWYQTNTSHYEGYYSQSLPPSIASGTSVGFPVTVELPNNDGYLFITEGAIENYSGMTLRTTGTNRLASTFENRTYYDSVITGADFVINGPIISPWRLTVAVDNLNDLVNCDIVHNVCPPPDPVYYPDGMQTDWIRPGKATWNWWHDGDPGDFELQKEYVDEAADLNCQYYVADGGWWGWGADDPTRDEYDYLKILCDYAAPKRIGIHVWAWLGSYLSPYDRAWFYSRLKNAGAAGVKFDFNNSESPESIQLYEDALLEAALYSLMINYHGMVKPTGEARSWPNEITREGVIGLEWNRWDDIPPSHYATIPFTRLVAGHGDTTPCTLDPAFLRGTTYAFQIATAIVHHSPLLHWAEQPDLYLSSPAVDMIRKIESCWDQTIVLEGSQIGTLAAFAKRKDNEWFVGILNGNPNSSVPYILDLSFLEPGPYYAQIIRDDMANRPEMIVENMTVNDGQQMTITMAPGGGYVANFTKLVLSPLGGWFVGPQAVSINSLYGDSEIRYTLDGSRPDASSLLYTSPIPIESSCILRAEIISGQGASHQAKGWFTMIPDTPRLPDIYLSDLNWVNAMAGWGTPQKDLSVQGNPLTVAGNIYSKGIGTHADSEIVYDVPAGSTHFVAVVGIDDEITLDKASMVFSVEIDDVPAAHSPVIRHDGRSQFWHFDVRIPPGSQQIKIKSGGTQDGNSYDHADWVNAGFVYGYDIDDLIAIAQNWLRSDCEYISDCSEMDLNRDNHMNFEDFLLLTKYWLLD